MRERDISVLLVSVPVVEEFHGNLVRAYMDSFRNNPHLGVYLLAAILKRHFPVAVLDMVATGTWCKQTVIDASRGFDVVGISGNSMNWAAARAVAKWLREERDDVVIVAGGLHPTLYPDEVLSENLFDYVVRGEAEEIIVPLIRAIACGVRKPELPGVVWTGCPASKVAPLKLDTRTFEQLPEPAWEFLPNPKLFQSIPLETSRGCSSACRFCAIPQQRSWRPRTPTRVANSIRSVLDIAKTTRTGKLSITDDCSTTSAQRLIELGEILCSSDIHASLTLGGRALDITRHPHLLRTMNSFVSNLLIGAECGYDEGLKRVGKPISTKTLLHTADILCGYGNPERFVFSFIIGLPWESIEQCKETIQFAEHLILNYGIFVYLQWFTLMPGSLFWTDAGESEAICRTYGYFTDLDWFMKHNNLSLGNVVDLCETIFSLISFNRSFYPDGRIGFAIPMGLKKAFPDWKAVMESARITGLQ